MAGGAVCTSEIKGLAMRATRLDTCGRWASGASAAAVSDGFISIKAGSDVLDGQEYLVQTASGRLCINQKGRPQLKWLTLDMEFCETDPDLFELISGLDIVLDQAGAAVGGQLTQDLSGDTTFALEVWTEVAGTGCAAGVGQWVYRLFPFVENVQWGDEEYANSEITFTASGTTRANPNWLLGPWNVVAQDAGGTPGPLLTPGVGATAHRYRTVTSIVPPTAFCGYVANPTPWVAAP